MSIKEKFDVNDFIKVYHSSKPFCDTAYFAKFMELLSDDDLLEKIRFANDVLRIPPVKTFIEINRNFFDRQIEMDVANGVIKAGEGLSSNTKQSLGTCFGYLYKTIYPTIYGDYEGKSVWVGDVVTDKKPYATGIKNAQYFVPINR